MNRIPAKYELRGYQPHPLDPMSTIVEHTYQGNVPVVEFTVPLSMSERDGKHEFDEDACCIHCNLDACDWPKSEGPLPLCLVNGLPRRATPPRLTPGSQQR